MIGLLTSSSFASWGAKKKKEKTHAQKRKRYAVSMCMAAILNELIKQSGKERGLVGLVGGYDLSLFII